MTASGIQRPDQGRIQGDAYGRIAAQAKRPVGVDDGRTVFVIPFSFAGALAVSESGPYEPHIATRLVSVRIALGTAGTSNTVLAVKKNGTALTPTSGSLTLGSGVTRATVYFYSALTADLDYITVAITTAGAGAKDLVVQARFG